MHLRAAAPLPACHLHQGESNDCGPFSAAIVINALLGRGLADPHELSGRLERWEGLRPPGRILRGPTFPWGMVHLLRGYGLSARWRPFATVERLRANLREGRVTIVLIGEPLRFCRWRWCGWMHYRVLYGWEPGRWLFVDPAVREATTTVEEALFLRRWRNAARILIEVEQPAPQRRSN